MNYGRTSIVFAVAQNDLARKRNALSPEGPRAPLPSTHNPVWYAVATSSHADGLPRIQAKLTISQPGDPYEQEADRVADQVTRMPEPTGQRTCAACGVGGGPCPKCEASQGSMLHRKADAASGSSASSDAVGLISHLGPGEPLDPSTRAFFEPRFGHDFSHVCVHDGDHAVGSAKSINASAYTLGHNVVFGVGRYASESGKGRRLLVYELAHLIQQRGVIGGGISAYLSVAQSSAPSRLTTAADLRISLPSHMTSR